MIESGGGLRDGRADPPHEVNARDPSQVVFTTKTLHASSRNASQDDKGLGPSVGAYVPYTAHGPIVTALGGYPDRQLRKS